MYEMIKRVPVHARHAKFMRLFPADFEPDLARSQAHHAKVYSQGVRALRAQRTEFELKEVEKWCRENGIPIADRGSSMENRAVEVWAVKRLLEDPRVRSISAAIRCYHLYEPSKARAMGFEVRRVREGSWFDERRRGVRKILKKLKVDINAISGR